MTISITWNQKTPKSISLKPQCIHHQFPLWISEHLFDSHLLSPHIWHLKPWIFSLVFPCIWLLQNTSKLRVKRLNVSNKLQINGYFRFLKLPSKPLDIFPPLRIKMYYQTKKSNFTYCWWMRRESLLFYKLRQRLCSLSVIYCKQPERTI